MKTILLDNQLLSDYLSFCSVAKSDSFSDLIILNFFKKSTSSVFFMQISLSTVVRNAKANAILHIL